MVTKENKHKTTKNICYKPGEDEGPGNPLQT